MKSQRDRLLNWLKQHRAITTYGAIKELGVLRCSERIRELMAEGHDIARDRIEVANRFGGVSRIARYRLIKAAA